MNLPLHLSACVGPDGKCMDVGSLWNLEGSCVQYSCGANGKNQTVDNGMRLWLEYAVSLFSQGSYYLRITQFGRQWGYIYQLVDSKQHRFKSDPAFHGEA